VCNFGVRALALLVCGALTSPIVVADRQTPAASTQPANPQRQVITGGNSRLSTDDVQLIRLHYEAGARTFWHSHAVSSLLLVEEGTARFQQRGSKIIELKAGQTYLAAANVPHWHGAAPDSAATVLQVYPHGVKITMMDPVTDDEYQGRASKSRP
jgi:quercetin dioxygenase-like cupin family protein